MSINAAKKLMIDCLTETHNNAPEAYRLALHRARGDAEAQAYIMRVAYALGVDVLLPPNIGGTRRED